MSEAAGEMRAAVVVDDDSVTRRMLSVLLQRERYHVQTAATGEEGLRLVRDTSPALVLVDAMMPPPDGYQLSELIRGDQSLGQQPRIVMITAAGHESDRDRALRAGVDDFLTKPFSPSRLMTLVRKHVGER